MVLGKQDVHMKELKKTIIFYYTNNWKMEEKTWAWRPKTVKLLEENIGSKLLLRLVLAVIIGPDLKIKQQQKWKQRKVEKQRKQSGTTSTKRRLHGNETISKMKGNPKNWKYHANHIPDKEVNIKPV